MFIKIIAAAVTVALLAAAPANAGGGWGFPNGKSLNGLSINGKQLNGKQLNGPELVTGNFTIDGIELPVAR